MPGGMTMGKNLAMWFLYTVIVGLVARIGRGTKAGRTDIPGQAAAGGPGAVTGQIELDGTTSEIHDVCLEDLFEVLEAAERLSQGDGGG